MVKKQIKSFPIYLDRMTFGAKSNEFRILLVLSPGQHKSRFLYRLEPICAQTNCIQALFSAFAQHFFFAAANPPIQSSSKHHNGFATGYIKPPLLRFDAPLTKAIDP
jgi:hypothetical protein